MNKRPGLLFVGAFSAGDDGLTGGTLVACRQLIESPLSKIYDVVTVDASQRTVASRKLSSRAVSALRRTFEVIGILVRRKADAALIFATLGPSWFERGLMALLCRIAGVDAFLFPRCAEVNQEIEQRWHVRAFTRFLVWMGVHFIFQGGALRNRFLAVFPRAVARTHVVQNWINLRWTEDVAPLSVHSKVTFVFVGWLHRYKGLDILIDAVARNADKFKEARFVLCGDGEERVALEAAAAASGVAFEFRGWVHGADKARAFSDADAVILPSRVEGMPNVLLEAMSVGRPVVATAVGSVADLVTDGVEGFLVPAEDGEELVAALLKTMESAELRESMGRAGAKRIQEHHDVEQVWKKLVAMIGGHGADTRPTDGYGISVSP